MSLACFKNKKSIHELSETADFLKVIAEENRLKILCMLRDGEKCVCEIWQCLDLPQNLTSHHLKILRDQGLISARKDGQKIYYAVAHKSSSRYIKIINKLFNYYE